MTFSSSSESVRNLLDSLRTVCGQRVHFGLELPDPYGTGLKPAFKGFPKIRSGLDLLFRLYKAVFM